MKLADKILNDWTSIDDVGRNLRDVLAGATFFEISNVAKYVMQDNPQEKWDRGDFPEVRPPFEICWFEYRHPDFINTNGSIKPLPEESKGLVMGAIVVSDDEMLNVTPVVWPRGYEPTVVPGAHCVRYDTHQDRMALADPENTKLSGALGFGPQAPVYFAISLMHCKNVNVRTSETAPKLDKRRIARGKSPLVQFRTLEIGSMTKALDEAKGTSGSLPAALHICRGHFKVFDDKPLFGKFKGRFWWPSHARGNSEVGIIQKDYEVSP